MSKRESQTTEKVRTRDVRLVWYTYSSGFTSLQGIIKLYLRVLKLHANKKYKAKTGKGDN